MATEMAVVPDGGGAGRVHVWARCSHTDYFGCRP